MALMQPVFFLHKEAMPEPVRRENELTSYEVCMSAANKIDGSLIEGAQKVGGLWKLYVSTPEARATLLSRNISIRSRNVCLYDQNPFGMRRQNRVQTEKITIQDLPLSVDNEDVYNLITSFPGYEIVGDVKFSRARKPTGGWSDFKNGDRFCYVKAPLKDPLPKFAKIGILRCKLYHFSQKKAKRQCKVCRQQGHKELTEGCPYYEPEYRESTIAFRSPSIFSNFHHCEIDFQGKLHRSVEHAYQYTKAQVSGYEEMAQKIYLANTAKDAKLLSKEIPESEAWDVIKLDVMTDLVRIKLDTCELFYDALMETGNKILVEATGDLFFASGLSPELTVNTRPGNYPGLNELGKIMMELRSAYQLSAELASRSLTNDASKSTQNDQDASHNESVFRMTEPEDIFSENQHDRSPAKQVPESAEVYPVADMSSDKQVLENAEVNPVAESLQKRVHRTNRRLTAVNRSSSVPVRKEQTVGNETLTPEDRTGIKKFFSAKRQASSSPEKEDTDFKDKQAKTMAN